MSKVIQFPVKKKAVNRQISITFDLDDSDQLVNIGITGMDDDLNDLKLLIEHCFRSSWWLNQEYSRRLGTDAPDRVLMIMKIHQNSKVHVMVDDGDDRFEGPVRQEWLKQRLRETFELALPSSSAVPPASGTISPSHSANLDQLEFSW